MSAGFKSARTMSPAAQHKQNGEQQAISIQQGKGSKGAHTFHSANHSQQSSTQQASKLQQCPARDHLQYREKATILI
jgi:hypothetical protein